MDYEKKYREALKKAEAFYYSATTEPITEREVLANIFPELKESEDKRIKKAVIDFFSEPGRKEYILNGFTVDDILAWLENQGEQKFTNKVEPKFKVGDWITNGYVGGQITSIEDNYPCYKIADFMGGINTSIPFTLQDNYHLWSIRDAKDGDVLACGDKRTDCPFIFHNLTEKQNPRSYCGINTLGEFQVNDENGGFWCKSDEVRPATKEQCDLLFSKMKEAGYEWDAEKLELIKVPKTKEPEGTLKQLLDEQEKLYKEAENILEDKDTALAFLKRTGIIDENGELSEKYRCEQTLATTVTAWSEGDERMLNHIIGYLHSGDDFQTGIDWLKSLKDRIQPQPKQEWSDVDRGILFRTIDSLKFLKDTISTDPKYVVNIIDIEREITWLKSLRPQNNYNPYKEVVESIADMCKHYDKASHSGLRDFYDNVKVKCRDAKEYDSLFPQNTWKPSDEQLDALHDAAVYVDKSMFPHPKGILMKLYKQLKKLGEG